MKQALKQFWALCKKPLGIGRMTMMAVLLVTFLLGYNATTATQQYCQAQGVTVGGSGWCCYPSPSCDPAGTAAGLAGFLTASLSTSLRLAAVEIENLVVSPIVDGMVATLLLKINDVETAMIGWWENMWAYNLLPALQDKTAAEMASTVNATAEKAKQADVANNNELAITLQKEEVMAARALTPAPAVCEAVTATSGLGAANEKGKMFITLEKERVEAIMGNKQGTPCAEGSTTCEALRYQRFQKYCDPLANGGENNCLPPPTPSPLTAKSASAAAPPAPMPGADIKPSTIFGQDTFQSPEEVAAAQELTDNVMGCLDVDPIVGSALRGSGGQAKFLQRRSYSARCASLRSVPNLINRWKIPGAMSGKELRAMQIRGTENLFQSEQNPSYREIMQTLSVDRLTSGTYATENLNHIAAIEMEKLTLDVIALIQLRDYYELLERTALSLAVEVSVMADQMPLPNFNTVRPVSKSP